MKVKNVEKIKKRKESKIKTKQKSKTIELIIVFIISLLCIFGKMYGGDIDNVDEMWTFSFSTKLADGYMIYRDYNMVQTPLFAQITAIFLKMFSNTMLVSHIVGAVECSLIVVFQYLILMKLKINKKARALISFANLILTMNISTNSYNMLSLMFSYLLLYIEIVKIRLDKYEKLTNKTKEILKLKYKTIYNILSGIVLGLAFLSKQTVGAYLVIGITLYYFSKVFILREKTFKQVFLELTQKAIPCILVILLEMLWLYLNGALYQFIDYTVLGLGSFGTKIRSNFFKNFINVDNMKQLLINILFATGTILLPIILFMNKKGYIKAKNRLDNNLIILSICLYIFAFGYSYPLANSYHIDMTKSIIFFVVIINLFMFNGVNKIFGKDMSKFSYALLIIAILIYTEINLIYPIKYYDKASIGKFKNMVLSSYEENRIKIAKQDIENFEKQNNVTVYILDSKAAKYNIYMERNGDIFDLPLCGNLGHKDYNLLIEKLESFDKHAVMLLHEEEDVFWQQSKEVRKYVLDNYTKAGNAIELNLTDENGEKSYIYDIYLSK